MRELDLQQDLKQLYNQDFPLWVELNLKLLKEKAYDLVDWKNLFEELESLGREDLDFCIRQLAKILENFYKLDNFKDLLKGGKRKTLIKEIEKARLYIDTYFNFYPSLKQKLPQELQTAWKIAKIELVIWGRDYDLVLTKIDLPKTCPYKFEEALNRK